MTTTADMFGYTAKVAFIFTASCAVLFNAALLVFICMKKIRSKMDNMSSPDSATAKILIVRVTVYALGALLLNLGYLASISHNLQSRCEESSVFRTPINCLWFRPYLPLMPTGDQLLAYTVFSIVLNCFYAVAVSKDGYGLSKRAVHCCLLFSASAAATATITFAIAVAQRDEVKVHTCCWISQVAPVWFLRLYFISYCVLGTSNVLLLLAAAILLKFKAQPEDHQIRRIYKKRTTKVLRQTLLMGVFSVIFQTAPGACGLLLSTFPQLLSLVNALWAAVPVGSVLVVLQRFLMDKELRAILMRTVRRSKTAPSPLSFIVTER